MLKKFLYKNKYTISYGDYGENNKKVLVLFHGLFGSAKQKKIGKFFASKGIRLITIARFGYGKSDFYKIKSYFIYAKIVQELLTSKNIKLFNIFGISAGTPHAYALASLNRDKNYNIFIYSGLPILYKKEVFETYPKHYHEFYETVKKSDIKSIGKNLAVMYESHFTDEMKQTSEFKDTMKNEYKGMGQEVKLQISSWGFDVENINQKVYLQHSKKDEIVPYKSVEKSIEFLKNPILIELKDKSHYDENSFNDFLRFISDNLM